MYHLEKDVFKPEIFEAGRSYKYSFEKCFTFLINRVYIRGKCPINGHYEIEEIL